MKKKVIIIVFTISMVLTSPLFAQVAINTDGSQPNSHAMLDVKSSDKGILIPRMSTAERTIFGNNLGAAEKGMMVFDTDMGNIYYWRGSQWSRISPDLNWKTIGNEVTDTAFIGTINARPLNIFTDNTLHLRIDTTGHIQVFNTGNSVFLGKGAGASDNLSDNKNVFIGDSAAYHAEITSDAIAIGNKALFSHSTYGRNIALGNESLYADSSGSYNMAFGYRSQYYNKQGAQNISLGEKTLHNNELGHNNIAIGYNALRLSSNSLYNIAIGSFAMAEVIIDNTDNSNLPPTTPKFNVAIGYSSLLGLTDNTYYNTALGDYSMGDYRSTESSGNTALGYAAMAGGYFYDPGDFNVAVGTESLHYATGDNNTIVGAYALGSDQNIGTYTTNRNTILGSYAGYRSGSVNGNVFIGYQAGYLETGNNKLYIENSNSTFPLIKGDFTNDWVTINGDLDCIGTLSIKDGTQGDGKILTSNSIGQASWVAPDWVTEIDNLSDATFDGYSLFMGYNSGANDDGANNNLAVGISALTSNISGINNSAFGYHAGYLSTGNANVFVGYQAGYNETGDNKLYIANSNTSTPLIGGDFSTAQVDINGTIKITGGSPGANKVLTSDADGLASWQTTQGAQAINDLSDAKTTLGSCVFLGNASGASITTGTGNSALGVEALNATLNGSNNTAQGYRALYHNTSGARNTAVGFNAFNANTIGNDNTALGYYAGFLSTGTGNVFLGFNAGYNETGSNKLYIANSNTSTPLIGGDFSTAQVDINGTIKITGGTPGTGKILRSDANGLASWVDGATVNGGGWTISGSYVYNTSENIGVGTATPSANLQVTGSLKYEDGNQGAGKVLTSDADGLASWQTPLTGATELDDLSDGISDGFNTLFVGSGAGASNTLSAYFNTATGLNALNANTTGSFNTAFGFEALKNNTAGSNTAIGYSTLNANTTGEANFAGGTNALETNTGGSNNIAIGSAALYLNTTGNDNTGIGYQSLKSNTTGLNNTAIGSGSLKNSDANFNVAVGFEALNTVSTGTNNTAIGTNAGHNATGTGCVFIGFNAGYGETSDNKLYIENTNSSIPLIGGDFSTNQVDINGTIKISGGSPGLDKVLTSDADGLASWQTISSTGATEIDELSDAVYDGSSLFMGEQSGNSDDGTSNKNTAVGKNALRYNTSGNSNTAMGNDALQQNGTGSYNTSFGANSLYASTGNDNSAFGFNALNMNTSGQENVALGGYAIGSNTSGTGNLGAGVGCLSALGSGDYNIGLGYGAGVYLSDGTTPFTSGTHNIFIGYFTKSLNDADTNQIVIGNLVSGLGNNTVVLGNSDITKTALYGKVGIGTTTPKSTLQVNGGVQMADDTDTASADKAGTIRYRADSNNSYVEMCVQTAASTYAWVVIHQETW